MEGSVSGNGERDDRKKTRAATKRKAADQQNTALQRGNNGRCADADLCDIVLSVP